jgi:hypothetical protein
MVPRAKGRRVNELDKVALEALAARVAREPSALVPEQRLEEDLRLGSKGLFLLALEVGDALGRVMTFDALATIRTVGDFMALVRSAPTDDEAFQGEPVPSLVPSFVAASSR